MNYKKIILMAVIAFIGCSNIVNAQVIAAGGWHSLVVCNDSTVKAFGENATGELGDGTTTDSNIPVTVTGLSSIISVSGGGDQLEAHSLALKSNGTVWAWGSNIYGGLGNATTTSTTTPVQVLLLTDVTKISAGGWHSVALKNDGTVWAWGWNTDGQLGDGTYNDKTIASQVPGLSSVTAIAAGTYHVLALKSDGTVWAWGDNISGQIGNGTTNDQTTPTQVSGLTDVIKIAAGRFFSLAVKSDGTVWTWGENLYGQLGNGTTTDSHVPIQVPGLTGITSGIVATGAFHCMAVKDDNTVWAWGRNTYGNLGDNSVTHRLSPVQMIGISDVAGMSAGTNFSLVYKTDGTFWGCGRNLSGQLGDGTVLQHNLLTQSTLVCPIVIGIENYNNADAPEVTAYPNPSETGVFHIQFQQMNASEMEGRLEVFDNLGAHILSLRPGLAQGSSPLIVDLSSRPAGLYYLMISFGDQLVTKKLIKQP